MLVRFLYRSKSVQIIWCNMLTFGGLSKYNETFTIRSPVDVRQETVIFQLIFSTWWIFFFPLVFDLKRFFIRAHSRRLLRESCDGRVYPVSVSSHATRSSLCAVRRIFSGYVNARERGWRPYRTDPDPALFVRLQETLTFFCQRSVFLLLYQPYQTTNSTLRARRSVRAPFFKARARVDCVKAIPCSQAMETQLHTQVVLIWQNKRKFQKYRLYGYPTSIGCGACGGLAHFLSQSDSAVSLVHGCI